MAPASQPAAPAPPLPEPHLPVRPSPPATCVRSPGVPAPESLAAHPLRNSQQDPRRATRVRGRRQTAGALTTQRARQGGGSGGGVAIFSLTRPTALTQRVVLLKHPLHGGGKRRSRLLEPRTSAKRPQQQRRRRRQRRLLGRRDFRLPEPSNRPGRGFRRAW